jgi:uncharacterized protein
MRLARSHAGKTRYVGFLDQQWGAMKSKVINSNPKTYAVILATGDEALEELKQFAKNAELSASQFTAIGAFQEVTVGFFHTDTQDYSRIHIGEQVEVLSLVGDIALKDGEPELHAHVVVGKSDGTAHGGHLIKGIVRPTLEVVLVESPKHLRRGHDPETGLALIDLEA